MIYSFDVNQDKIILKEASCANTGNLNHYLCRFSFDDTWADIKKFAVFTAGDKTYTLLLENDECYLPYELLENPCTISVGVYGSSLNAENPLRISTDFSHIVIKEGAYRDGDTPQVPEAALWEVYFERVAQKSADIAVKTVEQYLTDADNTFKNIDSALSRIIEIQNSLLGGEAL